MNENEAGNPVSVFVYAIISMALGISMLGCRESSSHSAPKPNGESMNTIPAELSSVLSGKQIFFGHQSVGQNIIEGIKELQKENKIDLAIYKVGDAFPSPLPAGFFHSEVGKNCDPEGKLEDFAGILETNDFGNQVDIAMVKFCYIDVLENRDISALFEKYKKTVAALKIRFPNLIIVHVTVPLTVHDNTGLKRKLRNLIKPDFDNIKREEYNALIRKTYGGNEPIFDLARIESTLPDGHPVEFSYRGGKYPALAEIYSSDGGHLNETGRQHAAVALLKLVTKTVKER